MAIGDGFLYRRLGKPRNHPDCRLRSLHVHQGRCNAQRSCAPQLSVSTCSRGCAHVHLNTEVHGTFWGDAADRAAGLVYYKVTPAGISCVRSQSLGFSLDDLLILPYYLTRIEILQFAGSRTSPGDAIMAISGHTTDQVVIATMTAGTVLGVFAVAARLFTRIVIVRKAGWDDAIICAGCVSSLRHWLSGIIADLTKIFSITHTVTTGKRGKRFSKTCTCESV